MQKETGPGDNDRENLLVALKRAQEKQGYIKDEFVTELADSLNVGIAEAYGVATFYSFLSKKPLGRNVIRVCRSLPCYLEDSRMIVKTISDELGISPGETTPDARFSLELTNCIGACDQAPAMLVNHDLHGNLTPEKISQILKEYK